MKKPLEVIGLSKTYNTKEAVKDISFKVNQNEIIGILGPNGCGKTTTIGMILGLLKPSKGKVLINGVEIENQRVDLLNQLNFISPYIAVSYTHLRAHETCADLVCRLLLEKKKKFVPRGGLLTHFRM